MEKAFTEREFQTNYDICFKKVSYKSFVGVQVFYKFRILRSSQTNNKLHKIQYKPLEKHQQSSWPLDGCFCILSY